ncbi:MAG: methyltransferase family protein [Promethearchaeota archaeon]
MKLKLKGVDKFKEKLPMLRGSKVIIMPIFLLGVIIFVFYFLVLFDSFPSRFKSEDVVAALYPFLGNSLALIISGLAVWQMWLWRDKLKAKYGQLSYQKIFFSGFYGIVSLIFLSTHSYFALRQFAKSYWDNSPLNFLVTSLDTYFSMYKVYINIIRYLCWLIFLIIGITIILRALSVFGIDYMGVVYLYFPEESEIQNNRIYSVMRHPTYAGLIYISLSGFFYQFTIYSFGSFLLTWAYFSFHVHFIEEKELLQRFGEGYKNYMKSTPAFFVNPKKVGTLLKFILKG